MSKLIFLCHPIGNDPKGNLAKIAKIIRHINLNEEDVIPFCPYIGDVLALSDHNPDERQRGLDNGMELIRRIHASISECRLYGDTVSPGMQAERDLFISLGIPVIDLTKEPEPDTMIVHRLAGTALR